MWPEGKLDFDGPHTKHCLSKFNTAEKLGKGLICYGSEIKAVQASLTRH